MAFGAAIAMLAELQCVALDRALYGDVMAGVSRYFVLIVNDCRLFCSSASLTNTYFGAVFFHALDRVHSRAPLVCRAAPHLLSGDVPGPRTIGGEHRECRETEARRCCNRG